MLEIQKISKKIKTNDIVSAISLKLKKSEVVGLLGPNGAGKTTCFYMISGLIKCDSGKIILDNKDVTNLNMDERASLGIGYLPQEPSIFKGLTVEENINSILEYCYEDLKRSNELEYLLEKFNITSIRKTKGISLSGGERRRVEIARALGSKPKFILLDEPFSGIDPISVVDIQTIISELQKDDIGILITDHNVRETLDVCNRSYIMNGGRLIAEGSSEEILSNQDVKKVYLGEEFRI
ncbi:MAG: ABC transporter ATP-binding protein [Thiotrichaceae bacterium]|nr:MAG: ABC transporter ATP-binding protein [Thiotrichaceae bacterium]